MGGNADGQEAAGARTAGGADGQKERRQGPHQSIGTHHRRQRGPKDDEGQVQDGVGQVQQGNEIP